MGAAAEIVEIAAAMQGVKYIEDLLAGIAAIIRQRANNP